MSDGRTHTIINLSLCCAAAPILLIFTAIEKHLVVVAIISAVIGTIFLSPDLDLKQSNSNRAWGGFRWIWGLYHRRFRHRKLSHAPILGTISRLIYLTLFLAITYNIYRGCILYFDANLAPKKIPLFLWQENKTATNHILKWLKQNQNPCLAALTGLIAADIAHLAADLSSSWWKKRS